MAGYFLKNNLFTFFVCMQSAPRNRCQHARQPPPCARAHRG